MSGQAFSLEEQINHKVAYIQQHMSQQPIAIIGHSIGENKLAACPKIGNAALV